MSLSAEPTAGRVIVVGAVNMDLSGTPASALRSGDSNPGRVVMTPGGVGRNIAENLSRLGRAVSLVTVTGRDAYGRVIRQDCKKAGIDLIDLRSNKVIRSCEVSDLMKDVYEAFVADQAFTMVKGMKTKLELLWDYE